MKDIHKKNPEIDCPFTFCCLPLLFNTGRKKEKGH